MITRNLNILRDDIRRKCIEIGRHPESITLVAVSKTYPVEAIKEAVAAGQRDFGENRPQEMRDKSLLVQEDVLWHFIGNLQKNKVKYVVPVAELIHSVDSEPLLYEIEKNAAKLGKVQNILLEVKTSFEESKSGICTHEELSRLAAYCGASQHVHLKGLMTMAPFVEDEQIVRNSFRTLSEHREHLIRQGFDLPVLSMGMSGDYHIALEEGATHLRIGTSIFGAR